jgi:hypothetical protein
MQVLGGPVKLENISDSDMFFLFSKSLQSIILSLNSVNLA